MKEYMITSEIHKDGTEIITIHRNVGANAYIAIFFGTHNEVAKFLNENNIIDYGIGH